MPIGNGKFGCCFIFLLDPGVDPGKKNGRLELSSGHCIIEK